MKDVFRSVAMAFSMFSIVPAPMVEWKKENMKYMICALSLVGIVISFVLCIWYQLCQRLQIGNVLFAAGMMLIPLALSGGIHMDGFCDTVDALSSHATPQRKREILKDSHAGAFAIVFTGAYVLLYFALCTEAERHITPVLLLGLHQILSRSIGALAGVVFPSSGGNGLLASFKDAAAKKAAVILVIWSILCVSAMIWLSPVSGITCAASSLCSLWYLRNMSQKEFGGMSGDLAGFLITLSQLVLLLVFVMTEKVVSVCC